MKSLVDDAEPRPPRGHQETSNQKKQGSLMFNTSGQVFYTMQNPDTQVGHQETSNQKKTLEPEPIEKKVRSRSR